MWNVDGLKSEKGEEVEDGSKRFRRGRLLLYGLSLAGWLLFVAAVSAYYNLGREDRGWPRFFFFGISMYLVFIPFALLGPMVFDAARGIYFSSQTKWGWLWRQLRLAALFFFAGLLLASPFDWWIWKSPGAPYYKVFLFPRIEMVISIIGGFFAFTVAGTLSGAFEGRSRRDAALAKMEARLTESKLQGLRDRLNPHFLFNALNAVVSLIRRERNEEAATMLLAVTELLDVSLRPGSAAFNPLSDEIKILRKYLEIERIRYGSKLRVVLDVGESAERVPVPSMLLQPLVENAVRHGISRRLEPGLVKVVARIESNLLSLKIYNDLPEMAESPSSEPGRGLGLSLTQARLETAYGESARLEAGPREEGGYLVHLTLPTRSVLVDGGQP